MANTPFHDLTSEDILSAHISGIQHAVMNVEQALNMGTTAVTGHTLNAVADQQDATLHNFIYEGTTRNWLESPAPVIYRNAQVVPTSEYDIYPEYGVIVFTIQQDPADNITADFTHVNATSGVIAGLNSSISAVEGDISTVQSRMTTAENDISSVQGRVTTLENEGVYNPFDGNLNPNAHFVYNKRTGMPEAPSQQNILMAGNSVDAFPVYFPHKVVIDKIRTITGSTSSATGNIQTAIYNSKGAIPYQILAKTDPYDAYTSQTYDQPIAKDGADAPITEIELEPGLYWLARYHAGGFKLDGFDVDNGDGTTNLWRIDAPDNDAGAHTNDASSNGILTGVRLYSAGSLPADFTATSFEYLGRDSIGGTWAGIKQTY